MAVKNQASDPMLTVEQAAERLGLKPPTLRAWMARRRIGYSKIGRAVRIPGSEIDRLITSGFIPASAR